MSTWAISLAVLSSGLKTQEYILIRASVFVEILHLGWYLTFPARVLQRVEYEKIAHARLTHGCRHSDTFQVAHKTAGSCPPKLRVQLSPSPPRDDDVICACAVSPRTAAIRRSACPVDTSSTEPSDRYSTSWNRRLFLSSCSRAMSRCR